MALPHTASHDLSQNMSSMRSFSVRDATGSIKTAGAYAVQDASVGKRVVDFQNDKLPFKTPQGLDFFAEHSFLNQDMRDVIESSITQPHWGLAKVYRGDVLPSDLAYFFFDGPDMQVILVQLWSPGSRFIIFEGSQNLPLQDEEESEFGIFTSPHKDMKSAGIAPVPVEMAEGGFTIIDGRVRWTILEGYQIAIGYASEMEIKEWGKIELRESEALRDKVKELNARGINTNFVFVKYPGKS